MKFYHVCVSTLNEWPLAILDSIMSSSRVLLYRNSSIQTPCLLRPVALCCNPRYRRYREYIRSPLIERQTPKILYRLLMRQTDPFSTPAVKYDERSMETTSLLICRDVR